MTSTSQLFKSSIFALNIEQNLLSDDNYLSWSHLLKLILDSEGLWEIVSGEEPPPLPTAPPDEVASFRRNRRRALSIILLAAPATELYRYGIHSKDETDPKELWDKLKEGYRRRLHVWSIRQELYSVRLEECERVIRYTGKIKGLVHKYNFAKGDTEEGRMADDEHAFILVNGLPDSWRDAVIGFWLDKSLVNSPDRLEMAMRDYEISISFLREERTRNVTCYRCQEKGHYRNQCPN